MDRRTLLKYLTAFLLVPELQTSYTTSGGWFLTPGTIYDPLNPPRCFTFKLYQAAFPSSEGKILNGWYYVQWPWKATDEDIAALKELFNTCSIYIPVILNPDNGSI